MARFEEKFVSARQDWETPDEIFVSLNDEFHFTLDVCATSQNTKCDKYFTPIDDSLKQKWHGICWMNPPFGQQGKWVKKAYIESLNGIIVVCLLPARTNTNWWHDYVMKGEIRFIRGRPKFKGAKHGLPQPLAIVIFSDKHGQLQDNNNKKENQMKIFKKELEQLINTHSKEGGSNTPDLILAEYLVGCLEAFNTAVNERDIWHGQAPQKPSSVETKS